VEKIAAHFNWTSQTVREVLHKWQKFGLEGLWEKSGRGGKPKYKDSDIEFLEECLKKEARTYNSVQLAQKLETERSVKLSPDRLRRVLKKRGSFGNEPEKATKENKTQKVNKSSKQI
jgi:transposase